MLCVSFNAAQDDTPDVDSRLFSFCHSLELFFQLYRIVKIDVPLSKYMNVYDHMNLLGIYCCKQIYEKNFCRILNDYSIKKIPKHGISKIILSSFSCYSKHLF